MHPWESHGFLPSPWASELAHPSIRRAVTVVCYVFPEQSGSSRALGRLPQALLGPRRNQRWVQPRGRVCERDGKAVKPGPTRFKVRRHRVGASALLPGPSPRPFLPRSAETSGLRGSRAGLGGLGLSGPHLWASRRCISLLTKPRGGPDSRGPGQSWERGGRRRPAGLASARCSAESGASGGRHCSR